MKQLIAAFTLLFLVLLSGNTSAQDFSNKGKEFWLSYSYHVGMSGGGNPTMTLYLTSDVTTNYTVEIYGTGTLATGQIAGGQVVAVNVPITYAINDEGPFSGKAIHVTGDKPMVVYSYITRSAASAATLCLPVTVLGKEYISSSYRQVSNEAASNSFVTIVAVEDNTTVEIKPATTTKNNWLAGQTYQVTLNKGEIYQILGFASASGGGGGNFTGNDLSGTWVRSVSTGTNGCKRIAVFSGSGKIRIPASGCGNSSDNLYQQLYPTGTWGKKYLSVPSRNNPNNYYRVYRKDPNTQLRVNGILVPASAWVNDYYEPVDASNNPIPNATPNLFEADQPISVAQYFTTQGCANNPNNNPYDPDMIMLNPVEQNISKVTLVSSNLAAASTAQYPHQHHIHVIMKNTGTGISSFRFDGNAVAAADWTVHPRDPSYSYTYLQDGRATNGVLQGYHTLTSDSGFLALAYGYANAESYGYSAGANVKDLYQFASIRNDNATVNFPATCRNTPFHFAMTFPYQPTQIVWQFNGLFTNVTINNPVADSVYQIGGKTVYRYMLPGTYAATTPGTFPIRILASGGSTDGCGGEQEINYDLQVLEKPSASFTFSSSGCVSDPVQFTDASNGQGRPFASFNWTFGSPGATSTQQNPQHTFPAAGNYVVNHWAVTDIGCVTDTVPQTIAVSQPPVANFGVAAPYCVGRSVSFTDTSTVSGGTLTNWSWNFGDGSPVVNASTAAAQTHSYATAGSFTATLQVTSSGGCRSAVFPRTFTVNPNPSAAFTFSSACLPAAAIAFTNTSSVAGGGTLGYQWAFGPAGATSTVTSPSYTYTTAGPHNVRLVATGPGGCTDTSLQVLNTVYAQPTSAFTVSTAPVPLKYCRNAPITFTSNGAATGSTVSEYHWDFGDSNQSTQQAPVKTFATAGTYVVKHWIKSAIGCESDTTRQTITIVALPKASFTVSAHRCEGDPITLQSNSDAVASGSSITSYNWTVNTVPMTGPQAATMNFVPATATSQSIVLTVQTEAGCTDDSTISINVNPKPAPNFDLPNVCLPSGAATFNNTSTISDGSIGSVTYQWNFGDGGAGSTQTSPTHTYSNAGPFNVQLTATSNQGCVKDATRQLATVYAQPQAAFTASSPEVCTGAAFTFTDGSSAPGSTVTGWSWNFGDGNIDNTQNPTHSYAAPGTYQVTLTVTSAVGCVSAATPLSVTVNRLPTARFTIGNPMCATSAITFTDASIANSGSLQSWIWDFGDGSATVSGQGPKTHTYANVGNYGVKLTVSTDKGCTANITDTARVHPLPLAGFVIPQNCLNDPFSQFTDTSRVDAPDAVSSWSWNFGDNLATPANNVSTLQNPQHRYTAVGPYMVSLTATTNNGCSSSVSQQVVIAGTAPVPELTILQGSVCSNDSVRIKDSSWVNIGTIVRIDIWWDASDPSSVQTVLNPVAATIYAHKYAEFFNPASAPRNIKLVAYSGTTCATDIQRPLTLLATPDVRFAPVAGICADEPAFTLSQASSANVASVPGLATYSGNGVTAAGLFNPAAAGPGLHTITYSFEGTNGCTNDTAMAIAVYGVPTVSAGADKFILEGGVDTLNGSGTGNSLVYVWTPVRWLDNPSIPRPAVRPQGDETYTLTVTTADGCEASDAVVVKMLKAPIIPNVFTPNGDGVNDRWVIEYLESYPGATIEIFNRYGQPVFRSVNYPSAWDGTLNGKPLPTGTYYYIINPKNGRKQMSGFVDLIR
ncbi:MAG: PKD domain-containing protein [Chitinophagaceae bacterium]|nr:MAG: PKD domain-containing protein [Chitinophagaceae bacterium]